MGPEIVICTFRVRREALEAFHDLLRVHWPTLRRLELVTARPEQRFLGREHDGREADDSAPVVVSIFEWVDAEAVARAHEHPDVAEIWEAMDPLCEARRDRPGMEFPHFEPLPVDG